MTAQPFQIRNKQALDSPSAQILADIHAMIESDMNDQDSLTAILWYLGQIAAGITRREALQRSDEFKKFLVENIAFFFGKMEMMFDMLIAMDKDLKRDPRMAPGTDSIN